MLLEALSLPFMQRVFVAALLASVAAGIVGTYVVVKRISSVTGGLAHAAFGGVGLGYLLGFNPMIGAAGFGLLSGLGIGIVYRRLGAGLDTAISMFWSAGMALGVVFVALTPGYAPDLTTYLFGSILFVSWQYVALVALLDAVILATTIVLYRAFEAVSFDEEFATVVGVPVDRLLLLLFALIALCVVTLIQVVGIILAIALLTVPAETARPWSSSLRQMMVLAGLVSAGCMLGGILLSYALSDLYDLSVPSGPLVILLAVTVYAGSAVALRLRR
jgi:zinc transport system permease protein